MPNSDAEYRPQKRRRSITDFDVGNHSEKRKKKKTHYDAMSDHNPVESRPVRFRDLLDEPVKKPGVRENLFWSCLLTLYNLLTISIAYNLIIALIAEYKVSLFEIPLSSTMMLLLPFIMLIPQSILVLTSSIFLLRYKRRGIYLGIIGWGSSVLYTVFQSALGMEVSGFEISRVILSALTVYTLFQYLNKEPERSFFT